MVSRTPHPIFGIDLSAKAKRNVAGFHYFYNIASPVGLGQENHRPSVLLVQYMLNLFVRQYGSKHGLAEVEIDGLAGLETDQAIRGFQEWLAWSPHAGSVPVDGILAPVTDTRVEGPTGSFVPPVLLLNRLWTSVEPDTFTNPLLLAGLIGEEAASTLWKNHPLRTN